MQCIEEEVLRLLRGGRTGEGVPQHGVGVNGAAGNNESESESESVAHLDVPCTRLMAAGSGHGVLSDGLVVFSVGSGEGGALGNGATEGAWSKARPVEGLLGPVAAAIARSVEHELQDSGVSLQSDTGLIPRVVGVRILRRRDDPPAQDSELELQPWRWSCEVQLDQGPSDLRDGDRDEDEDEDEDEGRDASEAVVPINPVFVDLGEGPVTCLDAGYQKSAAVVGGRVFLWGFRARELIGEDTNEDARDENRGTSNAASIASTSDASSSGAIDASARLHARSRSQDLGLGFPLPVRHFEGEQAQKELKVLQVSLGASHAGAVVEIHQHRV